LLELRDAIPTLRLEKPSTVLILQKAKEYIEILKKKVNEVEFENDGLRKALMASGASAPMPPTTDNRIYHSPPYRSVEYDPKEAPLNPYERKLSTPRVGLEPSEMKVVQGHIFFCQSAKYHTSNMISIIKLQHIHLMHHSILSTLGKMKPATCLESESPPCK
jgi:hypothetical protein